ncbi:hypothetical protein [Herpetosiphon sp. NSE202]|uniref:hypothetical protein n=1 Tax=Herpetosiphon sp. NSE202 TaxID=3351349 RepID=UPI00364183CB
MINSSIHQELQLWLEHVIQEQAIHQPQAQLYQHIATCDHCRGMTILVTQTYPQLFPSPEAWSCDDACDELELFIETERVDAHQAVHEFPAVWWHLLSCEECAALYTSLRIVDHAEALGALATPPLFSANQPSMPATLAGQLMQAASPTYSITFEREFLNRALQISQQPTMRRYRSEHAETVKILEDNPQLQLGDVQYHFTVLLKIGQVGWSLVATLEPQFTGWLTVQLGQQQYRQQFDQAGSASLNKLAPDHLLLIDGPDLNITLDPELLSA